MRTIYFSIVCIFLLVAGATVARAHSGVANVVDFGADPTCTVDSTSAIHAAIASTSHSVSFGFDPVAEVYFPPGTYCVSSINATGYNGLHLKATHGTVIIRNRFQTTSLPIIDASGSSSITISGIIVASQQEPYASVGFLLSDTAETGKCNKNTLKDVGSLGSFVHAALYIRGCTNSAYSRSAFQQQNPNGPALFIGGVSPWGTPSAYQNLPDPWVVRPSGDHAFFQCEFHASFISQGFSPTIRLWDVSNIAFHSVLVDNSTDDGTAHILINGSVAGLQLYGAKFYSEGAKPSYDIIENQGALVSPTVVGSQINQNGVLGNLFTGTPPVTPFVGGSY